LLRLPALVRRIEDMFPPRGGAPDSPPLPEVKLMWEGGENSPRWAGYLAAGLVGAAAAFLVAILGWLG
jgi:ubiquinone biosynthesis protein